MMYEEFAKGTGCRDNEFNHKVFGNLEVMYMNTDMTKEEIYEYGKKLVDNSKSEAELKLEAEIKAEIESLKNIVESNKMDVGYWTEELKYWKSVGDDFMISSCKASINYHKEQMKQAKVQIAARKWVLS